MKRSSNVIHHIVNALLILFYIPFSMFAFFSLMMTESLMYETNRFLVDSVNALCTVMTFLPLTIPFCIVFSYVLFEKGKVAVSYLLRFLPLLVYAVLMGAVNTIMTLFGIW